MPVQLVRSADRFLTRTGWVTSRHSFSFGAHYDPRNVGFGALLAHNEEVVQPGQGFDLHRHVDAEIVTWVLSGSLAHTDTEGRHGVVYPGLVQRMSAGRGVSHAERNDAYRTDGGFRIDPERVAEPVHFVQMWVRPDESGTDPSYQQQEVSGADLRAGWVPLASGARPDSAIGVGSSGATLWVGVLDAGAVRRLPDGPLLHLFLARGEVRVESVGELSAGDALRAGDAGGLAVQALTEAELLVWELAR